MASARIIAMKSFTSPAENRPRVRRDRHRRLNRGDAVSPVSLSSSRIGAHLSVNVSHSESTTQASVCTTPVRLREALLAAACSPDFTGLGGRARIVLCACPSAVGSAPWRASCPSSRPGVGGDYQPRRVFTDLALASGPEAYRSMDERRAIIRSCVRKETSL